MSHRGDALFPDVAPRRAPHANGTGSGLSADLSVLPDHSRRARCHHIDASPARRSKTPDASRLGELRVRDCAIAIGLPGTEPSSPPGRSRGVGDVADMSPGDIKATLIRTVADMMRSTGGAGESGEAILIGDTPQR